MRLRSIIGKHRKPLGALLAAVLAAVLALTLLPRGKPAGDAARSAAEGLPHYGFDLVFHPEESGLAVTLTLDYVNGTGETLHDLVLRTWAGAYASPAFSPAAIDELFDLCYPDGFHAGGIAVEGAWWNGRPVPAAFDDTAQTVLRVPVDALAPGESGQLLLRCRLTVPQCAHRFGHTGSAWVFGNALPVLSVRQDGAWRTDPYAPIGDPFVSECANYSVSLILPVGYRCASTGSQAVETRPDGSQRCRMEAYAVRDFAFALLDGWETAAARAGNVPVVACAPSREGAARAADCAAKALTVFSRLFGAYPWESYTVCAADMPFAGMEYPGFALISLDCFAEDRADTLELTCAHETAHQWFYALVGSDQVNEPWQDEACCEYAVLRYAQERYGQSAYENLRVTRADAPMRERVAQRVTPATPITDFGTLDAYQTVVYGRGLAFLLAVQEMTGQLDSFLRAYCERCAFSLAGREDFARLLGEVTGEDLLPLMTDYLDTLINY